MIRKFILIVSIVLIAKLQSFADPVSLNIGNDTTICSGNCVTLKSNITGKYLWSTGDTTESIKVCPVNNTTITLKVISGSNIYSDGIKIIVDKHGVYSGDADNNGIVNGSDVLNVGFAYGATGTTRVNASISWNAQHADNWNKNYKSGVNYKYADCNGDGTIDTSDLVAIHANWSQKHSKSADTTTIPGNPQLYMVANTDTFYPGEPVQYKIYLGKQNNQAVNAYGVNFSYQFIAGSIKPGSMVLMVDQSNCWLYGTDGPGAVMSFLQADYTNDIANIAITRTIQPGLTGYGQIGVLNVVVNDNVGGKRSVNSPITYGFTGTNAIDGDGNNMNLTAVNKIIYMQSNTSGIKTAIHMAVPVDVYPNPVVGNSFEIDLHSLKADQISISDMVGNTTFQSIKPMTGLNKIQLPNLNSGMYILRISTQQGMVTRKININQ